MDGQINRKESATSRKVVDLPLLTKRLAPIAFNLLYACVPQANANQGESASINIIGRAIDNQRQNNIYIAYSKLSPEQLGQVGINEAQLSQSLGIESQVKSANLVVGLNPKNGEEAPIVVRLVSYENMTNIVLFEKENEAGLEATEFQTGFLADKDNNLSFGLYIQTKDKDGNTLVVPFLEAKSSLNINDVNPDLVNRAKAGDQQAIEEIRSIILSEDKLNSITLTNPISGRLFTDDKNGANWEKAMTNLVELLTNPTTVHAAGLPTPTVPQPTPTQEPTPTPIVTEPTAAPTEVPIPMIQVGELSVPDPRFSNPELFDLVKKDSPIPQFVNAMKMAGIGVTEERVVQGITYQGLKDKDGNVFMITAVYEGNCLLFAQNIDGKWLWKEFSTKEMDNLSKITFGTTVDGSEDYKNPLLQQALKSNFSLVMTNGQLMPFVVNRWGWQGGKDARTLANKNELALYLHPGFYPRFFPENLKNANKETVDLYIDSYLDNYLNLVGKTSDGAQPTFFNIVNEAIWLYQGNVGWYTSNENPLYRVYGKDWISEVYVRAYQKAQEKGLEVGKDVVFIYNDSELTYSSSKTRLLHSVLTRTKTNIAEKLGLEENEVQLDVGIQLHLTEDAKNIPPYIPVPTDEQLLSVINLFSSIGKIHLTEVDVKGGSEQRRIEVVGKIIETAIKSGRVDSITLWNTFRFIATPGSDFDYGPSGLFNSKYERTIFYYYLLKAWLETIKTTQY